MTDPGVVQLVTAVLKPFQLEAVKDALHGVGVRGMTVSEVAGFGRQGGHTETYRGAEYRIDFLPKVKIEVLCVAADIEQVTATIVTTARTETIGDGKVWVSAVDDAVRIRTEERDEDAVH